MAPLLQAQFDDARSRYDAAGVDLERLTIRMAIATVAGVLPGAATLVAFGDVDEDWIPRLRTQRVLASDGSLLFDVNAGHPNRSVEGAINGIDTELLDVLIDVRPDVYSGHIELGS